MGFQISLHFCVLRNEWFYGGRSANPATKLLIKSKPTAISSWFYDLHSKSDCGSVCQDGAEASSTRRRSPWVNLRWVLQVGAWKVLSLREDYHLYRLLSELKRYCSTLRFGERIVVRSWRVATPTIGLVTLMVAMPQEML